MNEDTQQVAPSSLYELTKNLLALEEIKRNPELVGEESFDESQIAVIEGAIARVLGDTADKIDAYGEMITQFVIAADVARSMIDIEQERRIDILRKRAAANEAAADRLRVIALQVMKLRNVKKIEGVTTTLQANGLAAVCEVFDETLIPDEFKRWSIEWKGEKKPTLPPSGHSTFDLPIHECKVSSEPDKKKLLAALKEQCEECDGSGITEHRPNNGYSDDKIERVCAKCNGKGTRLIPGARLIADRTKLVIK